MASDRIKKCPTLRIYRVSVFVERRLRFSLCLPESRDLPGQTPAASRLTDFKNTAVVNEDDSD